MPERMIEQIAALASVAIQGSLVEVMLRCGTAGCGCQTDPARRHGPHLYLKYRSPEGRSTSLYVPRSHEAQARQGVEAWARVGQLLQQLSHRNRAELNRVLKKRPRRRG
jgi:hypothetical protein